MQRTASGILHAVLGVRTTAERHGASSGAERSWRQGADEPFLVGLLRAAALPGAGVIILRAVPLREASNLALGCAQRRGATASVRLPGHLAPLARPVRKDGPPVDLEVFAFMTTLPNSLVGTINHERMPVLLTEEREFDIWLTGSPQEAFELVRSFDPDRMRIIQSGMDKQNLFAA